MLSFVELNPASGADAETWDACPSMTYNWFTEGFDAKDLQEAKALLEELSH